MSTTAAEEHALPRTLAIVRRGMEERLHVGAQLYVSRGGEPVANVAIGEARPGVAMRPFTLMLWLSSGKPVAAVAVAQLWEQGKLALDDRVAQHIPEFARAGKDAITVRHLLTHTGGFRGLIGQWEDEPWERLVETICRAKLEAGWVPGRKAGYHVHTSWYVLAELVRRLDGRPFEQYVREQIFLPLGMGNCWVGGMSEAHYHAYGDRIGLMHDTTGPAAKAGHALDTPAGCLQCRPGSNGRGPVAELARLYEAMLGGGQLDKRRILQPQTVAAMTAAHRVGMYDHTFRHVIDWGLGLIRNSARYGADTVPYGYGPHASDRTFGHSGSQSSTGFCDPEHGLVVTIVFNGMPGELRHDRRMKAVLTALYEDLGLAATVPGGTTAGGGTAGGASTVSDEPNDAVAGGAGSGGAATGTTTAGGNASAGDAGTSGAATGGIGAGNVSAGAAGVSGAAAGGAAAPHAPAGGAGASDPTAGGAGAAS